MPPRRKSTVHTPKPPPKGSSPLPTFLPVSEANKKRIGELMKEFFGWDENKNSLPMQDLVGVAQAGGQDVMVQAPTGVGKTGIVAAAHVFPENKGRVTIFVSPLIALQEEMVTTFHDDWKLAAVAVNSTRTKSLNKTLDDICSGKYAVVLISPEMLQSRRFIDRVLRNAEFSRRFLSLIIDEAHTVSHWGAHFRKKYGTLGVVRAFLRRGTSVIAMSASLTPRVRRDVAKKLQLSASYTFLDYGNNRPNVSLVVRACHRALKSYVDLDFVILSSIESPSDIPATFIYADVKAEGDRIIDHLRDLLPPDMRDLGLIRPFNASLSHSYRKDALLHFKAGNIRIMVCTDAAGMGCNVQNIDVVVQWKLPERLSTFVQRAGRAARRRGSTGLAVLLVEPTAYSELPTLRDVLSSTAMADSRKKGAGKGKAGGKARGGKGYAKAHGRSRGAKANSPTNDIDRGMVLAINDEAEDENLIVLVQTGDCRRRVICDVFHNEKDRTALASIPCCDLCDPTLLSRTLPGAKRKGKERREKVDPAEDVILALRDWRYRAWDEDYSDRGFSEVAILSDDLIETLAQTQQFKTQRDLQNFVEDEWDWWPEYGKALWTVLATVYDDRDDDFVPTGYKRKRTERADAPVVAEGPAANPVTVPSALPAVGAPNTAPPPSASRVTPAPAATPGPSTKRNKTTTTPASSALATPTPIHRAGARPGPLPPPPPEYWIPAPLSPGQRVPRAIRELPVPPVPQGPDFHPSRQMYGANGRGYWCRSDNTWYTPPIWPPPPMPAMRGRGGPMASRGASPAQSAGRGSVQGRGRGAVHPSS